MLTYNLENRNEEPLYEYLYRCIKADIEAGRIASNEKLPSKRALAKHLDVSVVTVEGAYAQLVAEGYVLSRERKGYYASELPQRVTAIAASCGNAARAYNAARLGEGRNALFSRETVEGVVGASDTSRQVEPEAIALVADFSSSGVAADLFPYAAWAKAIRDALSQENEQDLVCATPSTGSLRLRCALAQHLRAYRGMDVDPSCIVVGAGSQVLYNLLVQLLGRNRIYAVENPGYPRLEKIYRANDIRLASIALDDAGMDVPTLREGGASIAHVMPSHQFPTGLVMPASRRYELLGWANECEDRYIIEDDYDCEFRFVGRPIPSLQSIDANGRVIYANTFAQSLGPAFRVGYLVLPPNLAQRYKQLLGFYSSTVSAVDQLALARFIESGNYERHVNRMRSYYRGLRTSLLDSFRESVLSDCFHVRDTATGLHFVLEVDTALSEDAFAQRCAQRGVKLAPLSAYYAEEGALTRAPSSRNCYVMNYASVKPEAVPHAIDVLEDVLRTV